MKRGLDIPGGPSWWRVKCGRWSFPRSHTNHYSRRCCLKWNKNRWSKILWIATVKLNLYSESIHYVVSCCKITIISTFTLKLRYCFIWRKYRLLWQKEKLLFKKGFLCTDHVFRLWSVSDSRKLLVVEFSQNNDDPQTLVTRAAKQEGLK